MSYGYGGRNPFDQRDDGQGGGYGGGPGGGYGGGPGRAPPQASFGQGPSPYNGGGRQQQQQYGGGNNVEMSSLPTSNNYGGAGAGAADPSAILNECQAIDRGIDDVERNLDQLRSLQQRALDDADTSSSSMTNRQLDQLSASTMDLYRSLTDRVRKVKSNPDSRQPRNSAQVGRVDRRLKQAIQSYQQVESQFRKKNQDQMARQYRIVRPDAPESEVRAAVEDTSGGQVFSQALMQSGRQGQARAALAAVQDRHAQILKIEQQMIELAQLFQDMDTLVLQQEVAVAQIEQRAEEVVENLDKGNEEIAVAVKTARATRKKKWWCLGICVAIVVIVVVAVVVYIQLNKAASGGGGGGGNNGGNGATGGTNAKRSLIEGLENINLPLTQTIPVFSRASRIMRRGDFPAIRYHPLVAAGDLVGHGN